MKLIIHAPNIHQGGGRTLLLALLAQIGDRPSLALLDERLEIPGQLPPGVSVLRFPPTPWGRLHAEVKLRQVVDERDATVLCLGNLPPLFKLPVAARVFLQNRYLLSRRSLAAMRWPARIRLQVERLWLRMFLRDAILLVQTQSMACEVFSCLGIDAKVMPFFPISKANDETEANDRRFDFLYVASGDPHKNHLVLLEAWCILAAENLFPSLCLTLDPTVDRSLMRAIEAKVRTHRLRIENRDPVPSTEVGTIYGSAGALVYPSLFESFGLPLIEATQAGLPVLAGELDYVRDVVDPAQSFDPRSPLSIARAVRRHLGKPEKRTTLLTPERFIEFVCSPGGAEETRTV